MAGSPIPSNFAHRMERTEPPLEANLKEQFVALWEGVFETSYDFLERVLKGGETGFNRDLFYCISRDGRTAATSHVTVPRGDPTLGGLGEVATAVGHRHQGMAAATCARASGFQAEWRGSAISRHRQSGCGASVSPPRLAQVVRFECHGRPEQAAIARGVSCRLLPRREARGEPAGIAGHSSADDPADPHAP